ncbi:MAG: EutN/CcmL family microcompartment protein [Pseudacidovorax sp.]|nr:EutN/CcmL family microcompartment protein [Pseudacidovorax sp.]
MQLARVRGNVVASIKDAGLASHKLLLLSPVTAADPGGDEGPFDAPVYAAIDLIGAGVGEIVLVAHGGAARVAEGGGHAPTDAAVVAIVDTVQFDGRSTFIKR